MRSSSTATGFSRKSEAAGSPCFPAGARTGPENSLQLPRPCRRVPVKQAILDGEVVVLRPDGTSDFQALQDLLQGVRAGQLVVLPVRSPLLQRL